MPYALDAWIVNKVEKILHKIHKATDLDKFFFENVCMVAIIALLVMILLAETGVWLWIFGIGLVLVSIGFTTLLYFEKERRTIEMRRVEQGISNPQKINKEDIFWRIFGLGSSVFLVVISTISRFIHYENDDRFTYYVCVMALFLYIHATDPLPPCKSKVFAQAKSQS